MALNSLLLPSSSSSSSASSSRRQVKCSFYNVSSNTSTAATKFTTTMLVVVMMFASSFSSSLLFPTLSGIAVAYAFVGTAPTRGRSKISTIAKQPNPPFLFTTGCGSRTWTDTSTSASTSTSTSTSMSTTALFASSGSSRRNDDSLENETPEEKAARMKLVRQIQASYYKSGVATSSSSPTIGTSSGGTANDDGNEYPAEFDGEFNINVKQEEQDGEHGHMQVGDDDSVLVIKNGDIIQNLPLFRTQWTELPGFQNVLNIHVPHYTHMFRKIFMQQSQQKIQTTTTTNTATSTSTLLPSRPLLLYGHVYLPGGSENLNNPEYHFKDDEKISKATRIGTLMQISDIIENEDTGQLGIVVQALDARFEVIGEATQHAPYTVATVKLLCDEESSSTSSSNTPETTTSDENENENNSSPLWDEMTYWLDWEVRPTLWNKADTTDVDRKYEMGSGTSVSPLVNYNSDFFPDEIFQSMADSSASSLGVSGIMIQELEYHVWVALDTMLSLLGKISNLKIPVPTQLLGLLPILKTEGEDDDDDDDEHQEKQQQHQLKWPKGFVLDKYAEHLTKQDVAIGTYSKSPFVRVAQASSTNYPSVRRASRLSYCIWILLENIALPIQSRSTGKKSVGDDHDDDDATPSQRQQLLEMTSVVQRLRLAYQRLEEFNTFLQEQLPSSSSS